MKAKRIIRNTFLIALSFVLILVVLAEIFKNDIVHRAITRGAKTFDVPLAVGEVDFSLLYRFPLATIEFNDILVFDRPLNKDSIHQKQDTIASISKLYASADIIELIKGNILVRKIEIEDASVQYVVDSLGHSNFDFLLKKEDSIQVDETDTTKIQGVYTLEELELTNIQLNYADSLLHTSGVFLIPELTMNGEVQSTGFKASTEGELVLKGLAYENYNLGALEDSKILFSITALNDTFDISDTKIISSFGEIGLNGNLVQQDSALVDIHIYGNALDIQKTLSIFPAQMLQEYQIKKASGWINFNGDAKGYLTQNVQPQISAELDFSEGSLTYAEYPEVKNMRLIVSLSNGYNASIQSSAIDLKEFHAETELTSIDVSAQILNPEKPQYDIVANISTHLQEIMPFIPDSLNVKELKGVLKAELKTAGIMPDSVDVSFMDYLLDRTSLSLNMDAVSFQMDSVPAVNDLATNFQYRPHDVKLSGFKMNVPDYKLNVVDGYIHSSFKGNLSEYEHMKLSLDSVYLAMPQSSFSTSGNISGFKEVKYSLKSSANLFLNEVANMIPDSMVYYMSGKVQANLASSGSFHIDSVSEQAMALLFENSRLDVAVEGLTLDMPDTIMNISNLHGKFNYYSDTLKLNFVSGNYLGLDFGADSTIICNVYTAAIQNNKKELYVNGNFEVGDLDYAWIEPFMTDTIPLSEEEQKAKHEEEPYVQKFTTKVNGKVKVRSFRYGQVLVENLSSLFLAKVDDGYFVADQLSCNAFGGDVKASVRYEMNPDFRDVLLFKTDARKLDVSRMMNELEEYIGQEDFKAENVSGTLSTIMDGKIVLQEYSPVYDEMLLNGSLTLENGALVKVKPIMEIEKIPMTGLKGLDNLRFSTLKSDLFLFKNKMYIPQTQIVTTSFDASFLGMYSFGEDYAYHVRVFLGEVLGGKNKSNLKKMAKESGFEDENEDEPKKGRTPLYLVSKSVNGKEKAWWDNRPDRKNMVAKVKLQKQMVDMRFHPGLVKYDTEE